MFMKYSQRPNLQFNSEEFPGNGNEYLSGGPLSINSPQNMHNMRRAEVPTELPFKTKNGLNNLRGDKRATLTIEIPDEKRCNLEDDESFEE